MDLQKFLFQDWKLESPLLVVSLLGNDKLKSDAGKAADKKFSEGMEKVSWFFRRCFIYTLNPK